ncbi:MAG: Tol-Pal system beta propeller repeat protein TolB [Nitrospirae bacterium]|nr:Tol-Pal system beta propeller repeat protein TolB [Nitrospirota bacterium]
MSIEARSQSPRATRSPRRIRPSADRGEKSEVRSIRLKFFLVIFSLFTIHFSLFTFADAKVYIDITSPEKTRFPIAIQEFNGAEGKDITDIIRNDLDITGFFMCIDKNSYIESPAQAFDSKNWRIIGAEAVIKGTVSVDQNLSVRVSLYDVFDGVEILRKEYKGQRSSIRQIAHAAANDIYRHITGEDGIFRTKAAFIAEDEDKKGLYIMDWDGAEIKRLGIRGDFVLQPHWSKDGTKIVYSSERSRQWGIYLLDFTKMTERKIFSSNGLNMAGNFFPNGDEIVFSSSKDETYGIYSLKIAESKITRITSGRGIDVSPSVSPDGKQIVLVSDRGGSPQIYIMSSKGYDVRRLTFEGFYNTSPSWSPDGKRIIFVGRNAGKNQIFIIAPDGSGRTMLTDTGNNEDPSFSPNGGFIIFSSDRDGIKGIYIMRANGESQKKITPAWLKASNPKWSPN